MEANDFLGEKENFEKHLDDLSVYFKNTNAHNGIEFTNQLKEETINEYKRQMQKVFVQLSLCFIRFTKSFINMFYSTWQSIQIFASQKRN